MFPIISPIEIPGEAYCEPDALPEATSLYRLALKKVAQTKHPRWYPNDRSLQGRWRQTSARYLWGLDRWKPSVDRFREAARLGGVVYSPGTSERAFSRAAAFQSFAWLIRLLELNARRMYSARRADWASELLLDGIRAAGDLRQQADSEQLQLSIESELHLLRELRLLTARRRMTPELAERTFRSAETLLRRPMDRAAYWIHLYASKTETQFQTGVAESLPEHQRLRRAIYRAMIDTSRSGSCRDLFRIDGTQVGFCFPKRFSLEHQIPEAAAWSSLVDKQIKAEIVALFLTSQRMDVRDVAASATIAHLCLFAHYRRLGFYPESLSSGFKEFAADVPDDAFAKSNRSLQLRLAGGERLHGLGVENRRGNLRTKRNQPLVYSVGPDRDDDRGAITWDGDLQGKGDWIFPLPAHRRPRHLMQFDLRKALVAMTLIGIVLAYLTSGPARQRRVIRQIVAEGGNVEFRAVSGNRWQGIMRNWLGDERFGTIETVDLGQSARVGSLLQSMAGLHDLTAISLVSCTVGEGDLAQLKHFPKLQTLYFDSALIPPNEYGHLAVLNQLASLSCSDAAIDDKGIAQLPDLPSLRSFTLSSTEVTGATFEKLAARLPNLSELVLYDTQCTDEAMVQVGKLRKLQYLDVDGTKITNRGVAHLSELTKLQTLDLQRTAISDAALKNLSKMNDLSELRLNETRVNGSGLIHLQKLPKLETLTMDATPLSDQEIPVLLKLTRLRSLSIDSTRVTPQGSAALSKLNASIMYPQWAGGWLVNQGSVVPNGSPATNSSRMSLPVPQPAPRPENDSTEGATPRGNLAPAPDVSSASDDIRAASEANHETDQPDETVRQRENASPGASKEPAEPLESQTSILEPTTFIGCPHC